MTDHTAQEGAPAQDPAVAALWTRLGRLGATEEQRRRRRPMYELMYDVLEAIADGTVEDASTLARAVLKQAGLAGSAPTAARPGTLDAVRARLTDPDLVNARPRARFELMEQVIGLIADGAPDANQSLARVAVGTLPPFFKHERSEISEKGAVGRRGDRSSPVIGPIEFKDERREKPEKGPGGRHGRKSLPAIGSLGRPENLFPDAAVLSEKISLDEAAFRYLRQHSRLQEMDEASWTASARRSMAMGMLLDRLDYHDLIALVGQESVAEAFDSLEPGTLFLMFHCGFIRAAKRLFTGYVPTSGKPGLLLAPGGTHAAAHNPRQALFGALRSLQDGHNLWLAPDGPLGKQSVTFNVLGTKSTGGEGAALLAHTARCPTAYFRLAVQGERLVLIVEQGPRVEKGENFIDFGQRFHRAYENKLAELLTGDPAILAMRPRWLRVFAAADEETRRQ